ncbi:hypothetical protein BDA96_05G117100 [Sorghum bicolor]|uniref:Uncharacterized protein n=2 Tax=Sorghum bicolor TaxID=4558 RepID=A0A921QWH3_SORBI|nr:hypothetical protein BDA96_05G117000 [Sorghum bicolor]KAG0529659.1 hypothetical protein BDA96_05G117100 [Sorghum bicolor]OQU83356.1 hypothetical protein SORBI_3005G110445 [Sorghum bicolor]
MVRGAESQKEIMVFSLLEVFPFGDSIWFGSFRMPAAIMFVVFVCKMTQCRWLKLLCHRYNQSDNKQEMKKDLASIETE